MATELVCGPMPKKVMGAIAENIRWGKVQKIVGFVGFVSGITVPDIDFFVFH